MLSGGITTPTGLISAINSANTAGGATTITLASGTNFNFTSSYLSTNNVLPSISANITILGNGDTLNAAGNGRLFDVSSSGTLTLENMTLTGGKVSGSAAKGGAVYNSGNLKMTSCRVTGNQAIGGSGQNAAGGGIYSNGSSLTLVNDLVGREVVRTYTHGYNFNTGIGTGATKPSTKTIGASNKAAGGTGASGQGGGLYAVGGIVNVTNCTIAGNQLSGGVNAQGGGIYVTGATLKLKNDVIGLKVDRSHTTTLSLTTYTETSKKTSNTVGASNKAAGGTGSGQGGGLYVAGGSVNVTNCTIGDNQLSGGLNAQGGGIYANGVANIVLKNDVIGRESATKRTFFPAGATSAKITALVTATNTLGSANTATGGSAMGAGLYVSGGTVSVSQGAIAGNHATGGAGQNGAGGGAYSVGASLTFNKVALIGNSALGGNAVGVGAVGGNAQGGELFVSGGQASLTDSQVTNNGSAAALGGNGGIGGNGGNAQGGGIYAINTALTLTGGSIVDRNAIQAGKGGGGTAYHLAAGQGGNAQGGGVFASATTIVINSGSTIFNNYAHGGAGGKGGDGLSAPVNATINRPGGTAGGQGGNGGIGQGGGLYAQGGSVTIAGTNNTSNNTAISFNQADAGNGGFGGRGGVGVAHGQTGGVGGAGGVGGEGEGGGMYLNAAPLTVGGGVTFASNDVNGGAGGRGGPGGQGWSAKIGTRGTLKSSFGGNGGNGGAGGAGGAAQGGGLFAAGSGLSISLGDAAGGVVISNNNAYGGHGGNGQAGDITVGPTYTDGHGGNGGNGASAIGGGAAIYGDKLVLTNAALQNNGVQGGGGGTNRGRYPFYDSSYDHTSALSTGVSGGGGSALGGAGGSGQGGGLYVAGSSSVTILNSTLANNSANSLSIYGYGNGGAGGNGGKNFATYYDSKMHGGNGGAGGTNQGAGLYAISSTLSVLNSTIADNTIYDSLGGAAGTGAQGNGVAGANGSSQGGGVFATGGSLSLTNDTIAWNFIKPTVNPTPNGDQGAGIFASNTPTLQNTIVALDQIYNTVTSTSTPSDLYGTVAPSSDHNLIGDGSGSSGLTNNVNGNQVGTDLAPVDPLFSAPASAGPGQGQEPGNYGGLTSTLPLYGTSPAIGAGNTAAASTIASAEGVSSSNATDQRGLPRLVNGAIDIGATEMQVDFTGSPSVTTIQAGGTITYMVTVTNGEGVPVNLTLTDMVPTNTSYVSGSANGAGWTITEPSATNSETLTATMTLNAGATATLSFSVTVNSGVSNTTITDTANLNWTGTNTNGSASVPMNTTVTGGMSSTQTMLTTSGNPSVFGQPVTFTATVSSGSSGTPTGNVTFEDGTTTLGTGTLSGGKVTFTTSALSVGTHNIMAVYSGDNSDYGSTSNTVSQVVNKDNTSTVLVSSIIPSVYGQSVTFKATVSANSPGAGTPTGTVTFYDGSNELGTGTISGGVATFTTSTPLSVSSHSITAVYGGDSNDADSTSNVVTQVVDQDTTTTTVTSSAATSVYGQPVTFTATVSPVSPGTGTPTGTVTFMDGNTVLGTGTLSNGVATFTTSTLLSVGSHSITAVYGGDTDDLGSTTGSALSQTVNQDQTTTTLVSSASSSVYGRPVTFTAAVSVVSPGSGTPTGNVTFYDDGSPMGTGTLINGVATFTTSKLPGGSDSITASYGGDTNDLGSTTSSALTQVVNPASTTTSLASSLTTSPLGQNVTFTATVGVVSPGSGTPAGSVEFVDTTTGNVLGTVALSSNGTASLSVSSLVTGSNVIEAIYSGQTGDFLGSTSSSLTETITQSILVLDPTDAGSLRLSGNASIHVPGNVIVDSSSTSALIESGNASIRASSIQVVGGVSTTGTATLSPAAVTGIAPVVNPFAYLTGPSTSGLTNYGAVSYTSGSHTLNPGIYSSIRASGTASLTLNPGIYIIEGGGVTVTGGASIAGSGVMLYNTSSNYPSSTGSYGGITLSGNGSFSLTAPTSGEYAGIVIFQPSANTRAISLSGNAAAGLTGTIYAPAALGYVSGNASVNAALVVNELTLSGNVTVTQTAAGTNADNAGGTAGQLLAGNVAVYVNNANGDLTSDELARIQDAINTVNAVVSPYGVTVAEVSDPTQANVTLSMGTNSAAGNYGQGVLGCYTTTGAITLIQGWNWYAGSDPTQIGANQYDFETTVTHELGHALGLGESDDPTSAMSGTLTPATTIRTLTTADLSIPYAESGADAQRAAPAPSVAGGAVNGAWSGQGATAASSTSVPSSNSGPLSAVDQIFADYALLLSNLRNAYQVQLSSLSSLWQQADAWAVQRLDALLSLEAGAMGLFQDAVMNEIL